MDYDQTITTAPYNTMNLPEEGTKREQHNFNNPQITSNTKYEVLNAKQANFDPSNKINFNDDTNFYDPTKKMVNNYLKTNESMYDNRGKYFDSYLFNKKFDDYIQQKTQERKLKEQVQLFDLDNVDNIQVQPYELPLNKLLINFKNIWFNIFDDLINGNNPSYLFTTSNFFYFGITFIVIFLLYIMLSYIFE